jgi:dextranase
MIAPTRAFYRPGEPVIIPVGVPFQAEIWHLGDRVAVLDGTGDLYWQPPQQPRRGYRVRIETEVATHWTAFDVLERWTDAPRYGYLFDFKPDRTDCELDWLLAHHVNGIQFYDWQYRHDTLLPPTDEFTDSLGRPLSLRTVRRLIDAAHTRGMAAMPYTAIYAASPTFAAQLPDWGLYDENGTLLDFAEGFLKLMNPGSPWRDHFVRECAAVLAALPFDGIHVDQYGEPRSGFDASGSPVDLPASFVETLRAIREAIPVPNTLLFNLVHNWPLAEITAAPLGFLYCELWPPQTTLGNLASVARQNRAQSGGQTPVIAVYLDPAHDATVRLAESVIASSGGYHLAHGETGLYLSDPYFPLAQRPAPELARHLKRLADFGVAYEELLALADPVDLDITTEADVWVIPRRAPDRLVLNVINGQPDQPWNAPIPTPPLRRDIALRVRLEEPAMRGWWVSPDDESTPRPVTFSQRDGSLRCTVPTLNTWTLLCIELKDT